MNPILTRKLRWPQGGLTRSNKIINITPGTRSKVQLLLRLLAGRKYKGRAPSFRPHRRRTLRGRNIPQPHNLRVLKRLLARQHKRPRRSCLRVKTRRPRRPKKHVRWQL